MPSPLPWPSPLPPAPSRSPHPLPWPPTRPGLLQPSTSPHLTLPHPEPTPSPASTSAHSRQRDLTGYFGAVRGRMSSEGRALTSVRVCMHTRVPLLLSGTPTLPGLQSLQTEMGPGSFAQEEEKDRIFGSLGQRSAGSPQELGVVGAEKGGRHWVGGAGREWASSPPLAGRWAGGQGPGRKTEHPARGVRAFVNTLLRPGHLTLWVIVRIYPRSGLQSARAGLPVPPDSPPRALGLAPPQLWVNEYN